MILTIDDVAEQVAVSTATVRSWVRRGYLEPLNRGERPLTFDSAAVWQCVIQRRSPAEQRRLEALAQQWADTP